MAAGQVTPERPALTVAPAVLAAHLVGRPLDAYLYPTDALERAAAVLRTSYGGAREELPHHAAMRRTEATIAGTLRARRALDEPTRPLGPPAECAPPVPDWADPDSGAKVPIVVGPTPRPPAPIALTPDRGRDF